MNTHLLCLFLLHKASVDQMHENKSGSNNLDHRCHHMLVSLGQLGSPPAFIERYLCLCQGRRGHKTPIDRIYRLFLHPYRTLDDGGVQSERIRKDIAHHVSYFPFFFSRSQNQTRTNAIYLFSPFCIRHISLRLGDRTKIIHFTCTPADS